MFNRFKMAFSEDKRVLVTGGAGFLGAFEGIAKTMAWFISHRKELRQVPFN
jgi:nucleoside-diphosphate-sugar epimerase